jgi:broad specificity phosphatase PhoE
MTRLVLARHGETVWHDGNRYAGRTDVALTAHGRAQAERLADWASSARLDALWCSPLGRARATAEPAARVTGLELHVDARLCEVDFGRGEGLTVAEMEQRFPDALRAFAADPVTHHLPGGEDPRAAVERALACLGEIGAAHPEGRVLVVAHTTLIRLVLCRLIGVPLADYRRVFPFVRNVALTELSYNGGAAALMTYNAPLDAEADAAWLGPERARGITR